MSQSASRQNDLKSGARDGSRVTLVIAGVASAALCAGAARAAHPRETRPEPPDRTAWHLQGTYVLQHTDGFHSPYTGPNSLSPGQSRSTADITLYFGMRPWSDGELWVNPEIDQGFGLDDTAGMAGFPSGEAYKTGRRDPYLRWQRAFLRQTWNLGGSRTVVKAGFNQFPGSVTNDRLVLTIGKFSVVDVFDVNRYAHDPRADFLNWALIDTGSFDYAADAWGYTVGTALEWYRGPWALRSGIFDVSDVPNSKRLEPGFREFQYVAEIERRLALRGRPGKLAVLAFTTRARMARLDEVVAAARAAGRPPDLAGSRRFRTRSGFAANIEQEFVPGIGLFIRAGMSAGDVETYDFTDIDRTLALGLCIEGRMFGLGADTTGAGAAINAISAARQRLLAAGGMGLLVGDGRLPHPASEKLLEVYYRHAFSSALQVSVDVQRAFNPAYNRDRGPAWILGVRLHAVL